MEVSERGEISILVCLFAKSLGNIQDRKKKYCLHKHQNELEINERWLEWTTDDVSC